jgi:hypothetical protein
MLLPAGLAIRVRSILEGTWSCPPVVLVRGLRMRAALYDIFRKDLLGTPVWMESAEDLETAKLRVMQMADRSPGEYFVFSQETEEIVVDTAPRFFDLVV